ncbi:uncharacterized protein LOC127859038 [Dreissena polymorpha]|uniref:uncharacterized protein LOC127859038 n=1 Tax=Dreissena polymorpha TaxID=45954 RepID=UPI00226436D6|nr:uncharacterized protein LOC127859038 [Dreissena polymorpha]
MTTLANGIMRWLIAVTWLFLVHKGEALTCLTCAKVEQPRYCTTVITCPDNDVCFIERSINSFGEAFYSLGCTRDQVCRNLTSTSSTSQCSQCCHKDLCNHEGCGEPGYPDSRGPVCYNCLESVSDGRCHHIDICRPGEVCSVTGKGMFGTTLFASKCLKQEICGMRQDHGLDIIGKRGYRTSSRSRSFDVQDCFQCCTADLCNKNCHDSVDGQWGDWNSWSACTNCNQTRSRQCNNPSPEHGGKGCVGNASQTQECGICLAHDCSGLQIIDSTLHSGVYTINTPRTHTKIQVYCDMDTDGGGWTILQRRFNGSVDFYRNFSDYENGFGNVAGEFWLGLKNIYEITSHGYFQLRVNITRIDGRTDYDVYGNFSLQPGRNYTLNLGTQLYSQGVKSDSTFFSSPSATPIGSAFSTYDHDVDSSLGGNCAETYKGGWWYNACFSFMNLNGLYLPGTESLGAMTYDSYRGIKSSTIMFKKV